MKNKLSFRIDDVSPFMNYDLFQKTLDVLMEYGCKPLLGIVPLNNDNDIIYDDFHSDFWSYMKYCESVGCVLSMHGYEHVYQTVSKNLVTYKKNSEFAGLSYETQKEKIAQGVNVLRKNGITVDIFFAPGHTFDVITLRALKEEGFKIVSDGRSAYPYLYKGLKHIPVRYYGYPRKIKGAVTIALHPCASGEVGLEQLRFFLDKNKDYIVDYKELTKEPCKSLFWQKTIEKFVKFYEKFLKKPVFVLKGIARRLIKGKKNANK